MMHKGGCFCGAVQVEVSGEPESMGYCHCQSCRSWSGGPVNAFTLWRPGRARHGWCRAYRHVPEDGSKPTAALHQMRWTFDDQSPSAGVDRRICKHAAVAELQTRPPCQLCRDST